VWNIVGTTVGMEGSWAQANRAVIQRGLAYNVGGTPKCDGDSKGVLRWESSSKFDWGVQAETGNRSRSIKERGGG